MESDSHNKAPLLTPGELILVKMGIVFPVMLDVIQRDMSKLNEKNLKLSDLYIMSLNKTMDNVHSELMEVKAGLRKRGIKIYEEVRVAEGIQAKFKCRGYDHRLLLQWERVRSVILEKGSQY